MSFMPTEQDWKDMLPTGGGLLGQIGKIFAPQYLPALGIAFSSGMRSMGLWNQGNAAVEGAQRGQQAAEFQAKQLEVNAGTAQAAAQRQSYFAGLEGDQLLSAIRARAGAGASDPTVLNLMAQASARRAYNMQAALYGGEDKARTMRMQAAGTRYDAALRMADAKAARGAYRAQAVASAVEGATSLYQKYWPKGEADQTPTIVADNSDNYQNSFDTGEMDRVLNPPRGSSPGAPTTGVRA